MTAPRADLSRPCPTCNAKPEQPCVYVRARVLHKPGDVRATTHMPRRRPVAQPPDTTPDPKPTDPPPRPRMLVGGCPRALAGGKPEPLQTVADRYPGGALRWFGGDFSQACPRPASAGVVHASWNLTGMADVGKDSVVAGALVALQLGDSVEFVHEADHKVNEGVISFDAIVAEKNAFYDTVKAVRPDLLVVNTLTAGLFQWGDPSKWGAVKCDLLGVDFDGVTPRSTAYFDWSVAIQKAQFFVRAYGLEGWAAPEVGSVLAPGDDGTARGAWLARFRPQLEAAGCRYSCAYEYAAPGMTDSFADEASFRGWTGR